MKEKTGIYLASYIAKHENINFIYQDINGKRDIAGCMLDVDLSEYDFVVATPPCNYYSVANYRRDISEYSQKTKHLLPEILKKLNKLNKPYIVENVRNYPLFKKLGIWELSPFVYEIGRHTYFTNIPFHYIKKYGSDNISNLSTKNRQGGKQVKEVIDFWYNVIK